MKSNALPGEELQAVIARALVDPSFCDALLNGGRAACLAEFPLTGDEHRAAATIQAESLQDYARQLHAYVEQRRRQPQVTPFRLAPRLAIASAA